jgi:hypothetical protein
MALPLERQEFSLSYGWNAFDSNPSFMISYKQLKERVLPALLDSSEMEL